MLAPFGAVAQPASVERRAEDATLPQMRFLSGKPNDTLSRLVAAARGNARDAARSQESGWVTGILARQQQQQGEAARQRPRAAPLRVRGAQAATHIAAFAPDPDSARAEAPLPSDHRKHLVLVRSGIEGSFLQALLSGGVPEPLAHDLIRVLGHELDLQRELRPGDHFTVLFERYRADSGGFLRDGRVLHASFRVSGRDLAIWRHEAADGGAQWFDGEGRSLRRAFLRTPLDGARISSSFGMRQHPVLGFTHVHRGIDFAAPTGTPVVAASNGVVAAIGQRGGYGRTVELQHPGGTETLYAHLSAFAPGLAPGQQVRQGQMIGRVGSTGRSTGPHLHYEIIQAGRQVNPATVQAGAATRLTGAEMARFQETRQQVHAWMGRMQPMQELAMAAD